MLDPHSPSQDFVTSLARSRLPWPGSRTVTPARILDTRDPIDVGLPGPFVSPVSQKLKVTGAVATTDGNRTVVPTGATGVVLNVTVALPTAAGFVSIRPGNATGAPTTSSLNFDAGVVQPNAVTVELPTSGPNAGMIDITYDAYGTAGPTTDLLIDVVGYTTNTGIQSLLADLATKADSTDVYTKNQTDAALAAKSDVDQVRAAMLADKVWAASVASNGAKTSSGRYTSTRTSLGTYLVNFDVAGLGLPATGHFAIPVVMASCTSPAAASVTLSSLGLASYRGILTNFSLGYRIRGSADDLRDCPAYVHAKFPDPDTGSPIGPLSEERSAATPAPTPPGASCTTAGTTTTCTLVLD